MAAVNGSGMCMAVRSGDDSYVGDKAQTKSCDNGSGMRMAGFDPRVLLPSVVDRPKMPGFSAGMDQEDNYVYCETQGKRTEGEAFGMRVNGCRYGSSCWRPLCPYVHASGRTRARKWAELWAWIAAREDEADLSDSTLLPKVHDAKHDKTMPDVLLQSENRTYDAKYDKTGACLLSKLDGVEPKLSDEMSAMSKEHEAEHADSAGQHKTMVDELDIPDDREHRDDSDRRWSDRDRRDNVKNRRDGQGRRDDSDRRESDQDRQDSDKNRRDDREYRDDRDRRESDRDRRDNVMNHRDDQGRRDDSDRRESDRDRRDSVKDRREDRVCRDDKDRRENDRDRRDNDKNRRNNQECRDDRDRREKHWDGSDDSDRPKNDRACRDDRDRRKNGRDCEDNAAIQRGERDCRDDTDRRQNDRDRVDIKNRCDDRDCRDDRDRCDDRDRRDNDKSRSDHQVCSDDSNRRKNDRDKKADDSRGAFMAIKRVNVAGEPQYLVRYYDDSVEHLTADQMMKHLLVHKGQYSLSALSLLMREVGC